jgi:lysophospholipase L1-like esterase
MILSRARRLTGSRLMIVLTMNKPGVGPFNRAVRAFAGSAKDVVLIAWHSQAARQHLLGGDGIHASASGYRRRAALMADGIQAWQDQPQRRL